MRKKVVISGSMKFLDKMIEWKNKLEQQGYEVDIPTPEDFHKIRDEEGDLENLMRLKEEKPNFILEELNIVI